MALLLKSYRTISLLRKRHVFSNKEIQGFIIKKKKYYCWHFSDSDTNNHKMKIWLQGSKMSLMVFIRKPCKEILEFYFTKNFPVTKSD